MREYGRSFGGRGGRHRNAGDGMGRGRENLAVRSGGVLTKGELKLLLLALFDDRSRHGYELIRLIKAKSRGAYAPSPGMIYPALAELAHDGLISEAPGEGGRRTFALAAPGSAEFAARAAEIATIGQRLESLGSEDTGQHAPIRRALANLELVLRNKLEAADGERIDRIVERLDLAAREIERLD